jgi:hypothetical protein
MMKRPGKRRSQRHPLLRFIRSVYRLLRLFFRPTRKKVQTSLPKFVHTPDEPAGRTEDSILTEEPVARKATDRYSSSRSDEVQEKSETIAGLSSLYTSPAQEVLHITVGELFELVQWQSPSSIKLRSDSELQPKRNSIKVDRGIILNASQAQQIDSQITVGKLFDLVQWQSSSSTGLRVGSGAKTKDSLSDSSLN